MEHGTGHVGPSGRSLVLADTVAEFSVVVPWDWAQTFLRSYTKFIWLSTPPPPYPQPPPYPAQEVPLPSSTVTISSSGEEEIQVDNDEQEDQEDREVASIFQDVNKLI